MIVTLYADAKTLFPCLTEDLALHEQDEHEDLFPELIERSQPEDRVESLLARRANDHAFDDTLIDFVVDDLTTLAEGRELPNLQRLSINLAVFSERLRGHITWENETILPLAERRLSVDDRTAIGERMARRRQFVR